MLSGTVTVAQRSPGDAHASEAELGPGDAITTPPATTLSFRNAGPDNVEVLFICVPSYPASDADTEVLAGLARVVPAVVRPQLR